MTTLATILKGTLATLLGALAAFFAPALPYMFICTLAILCDCWSAWELSRRVRALHPTKASGKFKSEHAGRVVVTLLKVYTLTLLAYMIDLYIVPGLSVPLHRIIAGAVCFWQLWSIAENESSARDDRTGRLWRILRNAMIDKTERHFDLDLSELKEEENEKMKE